MKHALALAFGLAFTGAASALAGPASDLAAQHIAAIASVDAPRITAPYDTSSVLHWIGGPLNGTYTGPSIPGTWGKFGKAAGPLTATIDDMKESGNPAGATVTANVVFTGKTEIKVRYVMLFQGSKLVDEIWQVDPKLGS